MANEDREWSKHEKNFLRTDRFISAVLQRRKTNIETKPIWRFLESIGGAAIITVLFGGLITGLVAFKFDGWQKEQDWQNGIIAMYSEFQLETHRENLRFRTHLLREIYDLLGIVDNRVESILRIEGPQFAKRRNTDDEDINEEQKIGIRGQYNKMSARWGENKVGIGSLLFIYFGEQQKKSWQDMVHAVDMLLRCVSNPSVESHLRCKVHIKLFDEEFQKLSQSLQQSVLPIPEIDKKSVKNIRNALKFDS